MDKKTILNDAHRALGARMVPFGGWDMPVNYGSQVEEHHAVRRDAGMFDVSHMTAVDLSGAQTRDFLRHLLANDVARLKAPGKAMYSCMLNDRGGVVDDLIVYYLADDQARVVVNAGTTDKDLDWMNQRSDGFDVTITPRRDLAIIAVQGPNARAKSLPLLPDDMRDAAASLAVFSALKGESWFVGRTGYTGEDGFEIMVPGAEATQFWQQLVEAGVRPCGLGARDTLRLEAGMNLYGSDMDEEITPYEAALAWTVSLDDHDFIGKQALLEKKQTDHARLIAIVLEARGVLRGHQQIYHGDDLVGEITSGGFSPTLERSIAFARVSGSERDNLTVDIRGKRLPVRVVKAPFVRNGQACIEI
ncbi:MAG: glycine cleavage system aminomethyltransferase GcvT [bacterium]